MGRMSQFYHALLQHAPDTELVVEGSRRLTAKALHDEVQAMAYALANEAGIKPGDRVALAFSNQAGFVIAMLAVRAVGAVVVPINLQWPPEDALYVLQHAGISLLIVHRAILERFGPLLAGHTENLPRIWISDDAGEPMPPRVEPLSIHLEEAKEALAQTPGAWQEPPAHTDDALAFLIYTSGTTGRPKGVMLSEANVQGNIEGVHPVLHFSPEDRVLLALPLFHTFGLFISLYAVSKGAVTLLVPSFQPKQIVETLVAERVTILPLVPTMFAVVLDVAHKLGISRLGHLRFCVSGGAALPRTLLEKLQSQLGWHVLEGYGLTETSPVVAVNPPSDHRPGSVGPPLPNVQICIVDEQGVPIADPVHTAGEVRIKGPNVMQGYYQDETATRAVMHDGWFATGDVGHLDKDGYLYLSGRKKDLIIKAGENISPLTIEDALLAHPGVAQAAVIGIPDDKLGERILACVVPREGITLSPDELRSHCLSKLNAFLVPDKFRLYDELPMTGSGKVQKAKLRDQNQPSSPALPSASA